MNIFKKFALLQRNGLEMKNLNILFCFITFFSTSTFAQTITNCRNPSGFAYYNHSGVILKKDSGFQKDTITDGITSFVKLPNGNFDINIVDVRKQIISFTQGGGEVVLLRSGKNDATFLHFYPGKVIELYSFWLESDGKAKFSMI